MQIVVISGGSSGIGLSCVNKFIQEGYFVYNLDITESINSSDNYKWLCTDVRNPSSITSSINTIIQQDKQIDILIISAGRHLSASIENTSDEVFEDILSLNLKGAFWLTKSVIPYMKEKKYGNVITIGSDQSSVAKPNSTVYGMTKAALLSLTKSIALDYAKFNIRANCIGAGTIDTPLYKNAIIKYSENSGIPLSQIEQAEAKEQPLGRVGKPEEIAELAYFLAQDKATFITGALIPIDGGYTAR